MRTTAEAVGRIIELDESIALDPFIESANALVTELCAPLGYDATRLELIERYLSAHFYTLRDPRRTQETAGPVSETFQSKVDLFLKTSHYGQHAMLLDTLGGLSALDASAGKAKLALSVTWVGSDVERVFPGRRFCLPDI